MDNFWKNWAIFIPTSGHTADCLKLHNPSRKHKLHQRSISKWQPDINKIQNTQNVLHTKVAQQVVQSGQHSDEIARDANFNRDNTKERLSITMQFAPKPASFECNYFLLKHLTFLYKHWLHHKCCCSQLSRSKMWKWSSRKARANRITKLWA